MVKDVRGVITNFGIVSDVTLVTVYNLPNTAEMTAKIFECLADGGVNVDMISLNPSQGLTQTLSFSASDSDLTSILTTVGRFKGSYPDVRTDLNSKNCKLTFEGEGMKTRCGVAASVFSTLAGAGADIRLITTSETKISCLVDEVHLNAVCDAVERDFGIKYC